MDLPYPKTALPIVAGALSLEQLHYFYLPCEAVQQKNISKHHHVKKDHSDTILFRNH